MNMNVSLTDELHEFVKAKVESGRYTSLAVTRAPPTSPASKPRGASF